MLACPSIAMSPRFIPRFPSIRRSDRAQPKQRVGSPRVLGGLFFAILVAGVPVEAAGAAPSAEMATPTELELQDTRCDDAPSLDEAKLIAARDLHIRGEESYARGDYLGAVEAWEQVLLLMPDKEADLRVEFAHAHRGAYVIDHDQAHLRKAHAFFTDQLASLSSDDAAREDLEAELAEIEAEIVALEKARAQAQTEREEAIRNDQIRRSQQERAKVEIGRQRRIQKIYYGIGGSLAGLGVGSLAAMTAFLVRGAEIDREGRNTASMINVPDGRYQELLAQGEAQNWAAVTTGVVGGVLAISSVSLLVVVAIQHKQVSGTRRERVTLSPTLRGAKLRF